MPIPRRPRTSREMNGAFGTWAIALTILLFMAISLMRVGVPSSYQVQKKKSNESPNTASLWPQRLVDHPRTHPTIPVYVQGFYIIPEKGIWSTHQQDGDDSVTVAENSQLCQVGVVDSSKWIHPLSPVLKESSNGREPEPIHRAYPIHAGDANEQGLRYIPELERCAKNMLKRFETHKLRMTPGFEFALQDCKSAIDSALEGLRMVERDAVSPETALPKDQDVNSYTSIPAKRTLTRSATASQHKDNSEKFYCRISTAHLDHCSHDNDTESQKSGRICYLNNSVDDFKGNTPLECKFCRPYIDHQAIRIHSKRGKGLFEHEPRQVEAKPVNWRLIVYPTSAVCSLLAIAISIWGFYRIGLQRGANRQAKAQQGYEGRVPVMPTAARSMIDGTSEIPRSAPLIPLSH